MSNKITEITETTYDKDIDYRQSHKEFCKNFIDDITEIYTKYKGKIADVYMCSLAEAIIQIKKRRESTLEIIAESKEIDRVAVRGL